MARSLGVPVELPGQYQISDRLFLLYTTTLNIKFLGLGYFVLNIHHTLLLDILKISAVRILYLGHGMSNLICMIRNCRTQ